MREKKEKKKKKMRGQRKVSTIQPFSRAGVVCIQFDYTGLVYTGDLWLQFWGKGVKGVVGKRAVQIFDTLA